ncbi:DUF4149 domain-containing protein [Pelomonas sp. SE-A7]|nr:DUF4149 domain-containing protein [Pelomonas sp. SE-A7]MDM4764823.1 DUF4149 domain-containing protein [Pelomonas sp. SE-A7]
MAALWGGFLLCVATTAAPIAFAVLERAQAGKYVGGLFELDAQVSLAAGLLLVMMERRLQRDQGGQVMSVGLLLPLLALFCTAAGFYGVQPAMEAARVGQGSLSFGALHAISSGFFVIKLLAVLLLAWRAGGAPKA